MIKEKNQKVEEQISKTHTITWRGSDWACIEYSFRPHYLDYTSYDSLPSFLWLHCMFLLQFWSFHSHFPWFPISLWLILILKWGNWLRVGVSRGCVAWLGIDWTSFLPFPLKTLIWGSGWIIWGEHLWLRCTFLSEVCILSERSMFKLKKTIFVARIIDLRSTKLSQNEP